MFLGSDYGTSTILTTKNGRIANIPKKALTEPKTSQKIHEKERK